MRNSTAYIIAGVISLTSLPMYWQIYKRSHPSSAAASPSPVVYTPQQRRLVDYVHSPDFRLWVKRQTTQLKPDERCIASMVVNVKNNVYTPLKERGAIVPCHGRLRDRPVVEWQYATAGSFWPRR